MRPGLFISFEGGEGAGKSTQIRLLAASLAAERRAVTLTREPGGSPLAEAIRTLILTHEAASDDAMTQALLFAAARRDHVHSVILPALTRGEYVLCDRFIDSTRAYQGGRISESALETTLHLATEGLTPNLTFLLDIPPAQGLARAKQRAGGNDTFERANGDFHAAVRTRFLALAAANPQRFYILDATKPQAEIAAEILATIHAYCLQA